jgi:hypothetical protein
MRVTLTKRRCPHCGYPITPEEIDRQAADNERRLLEIMRRRDLQNTSLLVVTILAVMAVSLAVWLNVVGGFTPSHRTDSGLRGDGGSSSRVQERKSDKPAVDADNQNIAAKVAAEYEPKIAQARLRIPEDEKLIAAQKDVVVAQTAQIRRAAERKKLKELEDKLAEDRKAVERLEREQKEEVARRLAEFARQREKPR